MSAYEGLRIILPKKNIAYLWDEIQEFKIHIQSNALTLNRRQL